MKKNQVYIQPKSSFHKGNGTLEGFQMVLKKKAHIIYKERKDLMPTPLTMVGKFWLSISVILATLPRPLGREILAILCCAYIRSLPLLCPLILHMFKFMII